MILFTAGLEAPPEQEPQDPNRHVRGLASRRGGVDARQGRQEAQEGEGQRGHRQLRRGRGNVKWR